MEGCPENIGAVLAKRAKALDAAVSIVLGRHIKPTKEEEKHLDELLRHTVPMDECVIDVFPDDRPQPQLPLYADLDNQEGDVLQGGTPPGSPSSRTTEYDRLVPAEVCIFHLNAVRSIFCSLKLLECNKILFVVQMRARILEVEIIPIVLWPDAEGEDKTQDESASEDGPQVRPQEQLTREPKKLLLVRSPFSKFQL